MYSIGIIAAAASIPNIMRIDAEMQKECRVTYLSYSSIEHLLYVYRDNAERFDAIIFGGSYSYNLVKENIGKFTRPAVYFSVADRDYFRMIAQIAIENPGQDFSRVYIDTPDVSVDFESIFGRSGLPAIAIEDEKKLSYSDYWEYAIGKYRMLWGTGKVDIFITRFSSMADMLRKERIGYRLLLPSEQSMIETFGGLRLQLLERQEHKEAMCVGLVAANDAEAGDDSRKLAILEDFVGRFNTKAGGIFLSYRQGDRLELTAAKSIMMKLTRGGTTCPLLTYLEENVPFSVSIGWGFAENILKAHQNAMHAWEASRNQEGSSAFAVNEDLYLIGPMAEYNEGTASEERGGKIRMVLPEIYAEKIRNVVLEDKEQLFSAQEMGKILGISKRSAARQLERMEKIGAAQAQYRRAIHQKGRPVKYYKIMI